MGATRYRRRLVYALVAQAGLLFVGASRAAIAEKTQSPRVTIGPYLTGLSASGVDVRFELNRAAAAAVEIAREKGDAEEPTITLEDTTAATMHVVHAVGLAPATRFSYVVRVAGKIGGEGHFTTAPNPDSGRPVKFLVYGDERSDPTAHAAVVRALAGTACDFLVNTGDMVADGGHAEEWQSFFDIEAGLLRDRALFVAIGNHELYEDRAGANFARYLGFLDAGTTPQPYGTVRLSDVRFFFLNAMHDWASGEDRRWLERELAHADSEVGLSWRVAVMHQGPWSCGPHGGSSNLLRAHLPELLAAHGVDLVISGHDHIYERGDVAGVKYVVSGGGGAPLYPASKIASTRRQESTYHFVEITTGGDAIRLVARRIDGSLLDQCGFRKGADWDCDVAPSERIDGARSATAGLGVAGPPSGCTTRGAIRALGSGGLLLCAAFLAVRIARAKRR